MYLHCEGLPLNTSQGLINALFKSCAPITNWLESSASSITQKRPLQIKIHMIYTWKALKGISSLLMSHKCFKHQNFYSWCEKKWAPVRMQRVGVHACVWDVQSLKSVPQTHKRTSLTGNQYQWGRTLARSKPSVKHVNFMRFYFTNKWNHHNLLCISIILKQLFPYRQSTHVTEYNRSISTLMQY